MHYSLKPRIMCVLALYKDTHVYIFLFGKIKPYTYKFHCFKIHFHTNTWVQKQIPKCYITCVQIFANAKLWPYYMYNIKSWFFSYKVVTWWMKKCMIFGPSLTWMCKPILYIYFSIALSLASCISTSCLIAICLLYIRFVHVYSK